MWYCLFSWLTLSQNNTSLDEIIFYFFIVYDAIQNNILTLDIAYANYFEANSFVLSESCVFMRTNSHSSLTNVNLFRLNSWPLFRRSEDNSMKELIDAENTFFPLKLDWSRLRIDLEKFRSWNDWQFSAFFAQITLECSLDFKIFQLICCFCPEHSSKIFLKSHMYLDNPEKDPSNHRLHDATRTRLCNLMTMTMFSPKCT